MKGEIIMPFIYEYDRSKAVDYAHKWAYGRNPAYFNFDNYGGDCTNFSSQVIYAGSGVMNYTPVYGWYYIDSYRRSASWTGVEYLYKFLINNKGIGPFAERADVYDIQVGDIIQLSFGNDGRFTHSPVVVATGVTPSVDNILVAAHTFDADNRPLNTYNWTEIRYLHIIGVYK